MLFLYKIYIFTTLVAFGLAAKDPTCTLQLLDETLICKAGTQDTTLRRGLVSDKPDVQSIVLKKCRINIIEYEAFKFLPSLKTLDLSDNKLTDMKLGVLDELQTVTFLNISSNNLRKLPVGLFDQMSKIEVLDMRSNPYDFLETGIFDPLQNLRHLDLSSSNISILPGDIFQRLKDLKFLDLSRNNISNAPDDLLQSLPKLEVLNLDRCFLSKVPKYLGSKSLNALQRLIISRNLITSLSDGSIFKFMTNLRFLDLTGNRISQIEGTVFNPLSKLTKLNLRFNKLKMLPPNCLDNLTQLKYLNMSSNKIEYLPDGILAYSQQLLALNLGHNLLTYAPENLPLSLPNLREIYFAYNPWQCECLVELLISIKKTVAKYTTFDGKRKVCVPSVTGTCERNSTHRQKYLNTFFY